MTDRTDAARDQVLDAAAELFMTKSFTGTTDREIATRAGVSYASPHFHFAGKNEILAELLQRSARPTVEEIAEIEATVPPGAHATALYLLILADVRGLAEAPHNIGALPTMPDVTNSRAYVPFGFAYQDLIDAYARLGAQVTSPAVTATLSTRELGQLLMQQVESVTNIRQEGEAVTSEDARSIAASCLRMCGVDQETIASLLT
jgi:AcrR family transcriptional regulator